MDKNSDEDISDYVKSIEKQLDSLKMNRDTVLNEMENMMQDKVYLVNKVKSLSKIIPTLVVLQNEAEKLVTTINDISDSSESISKKIRLLDLARSRVDECQTRVGDLIDLDLCSQGVQTAIYEEDYEKGAGHVHRFLSMDQSLLKQTATDMEEISSVMKAVATLESATSQLRNIVKQKFLDAVQTEDLSSVERFFKIFPLLGMKQEGINHFCEYLCTKLNETAQKNLGLALKTPIADKRFTVIYADTLTLLFEGVARIIDIHQPLIETYYGPGHLLKAITIIQKECDQQAKQCIVEFIKNRQIAKRVNQIYEGLKSSGKGEKLDPKELDVLVHEITVMHARCELYFKFIRRKVTSDIDVAYHKSEERQVALGVLEKMVNNSELTQYKHELLSKYLQLEQYFMEESISKAVVMDTVESGQLTSSMVDDTFFIIRKCVRRAISSGSLDGICAVINNACGVLENDYCSVLRNRLKQGYPSGYLDLTQAYNVLQTSIQQGRIQSGDTEQSRNTFLIALNNAENSIEYVEALCDSILKDVENSMPNMAENQRGKLESCLSGLSSVTINLKEVIEFGMQQLRVSAIKPRVNPWVDSFLSVNHQFNEEELSDYEAGESFAEKIIVNLDSFLNSFKGNLTPANYDNFVGIIATEVAARLEKDIYKTTFNRLGGLVLDKEIRSLAAFLTSSTSWSIRAKFTRLTQIATILNLEHLAEIHDYWGSHEGALTWRLTPQEIRNVMCLRIDFKTEDIRKLRL